jgi:hypothetical protein
MNKDNELLFVARIDDKAFGVTINPNDPGRWLTKAEHDAEHVRRSNWTELELARHRKVFGLHYDAIAAKVMAATSRISKSKLDVDSIVITTGCAPAGAERVYDANNK